MAEISAPTLDVSGPAAPPRANGELVFAAPWESRVFGLTMSLHGRGLFEWEDFRRQLIAEIADWERRTRSGEGWSYYERWQAALEKVLAAKGLCGGGEIDERAAAFAARAPGHDHERA